MILRVVRGRIRPGERDDVLAAMRGDYEPILSATAGLVRFVLGLRPTDEGGDRLAALLIWNDFDSVQTAYGGELAAPRTIDGRDRGAIYEDVVYYELEAGRMPAGTPRILRLTAGSVGRGLDADIQAGLRTRLPDLPADAVEAYVGRRVLGPVVEIAFLSTWSAPPAEVDLGAPIWPDLSARYDAYALELYEVVLIGDGRAADPAG
ncbi:MAG TPA: hypothetical protein VFI34_02205 [Candidatus Limnocylindrales bacterium]|nr:hypothetical protein [Candidatus Limnocylindrales bacterium]